MTWAEKGMATQIRGPAGADPKSERRIPAQGTLDAGRAESLPCALDGTP
jgi:hypothetical protein